MLKLASRSRRLLSISTTKSKRDAVDWSGPRAQSRTTILSRDNLLSLPQSRLLLQPVSLAGTPRTPSCRVESVSLWMPVLALLVKLMYNDGRPNTRRKLAMPDHKRGRPPESQSPAKRNAQLENSQQTTTFLYVVGMQAYVHKQIDREVCPKGFGGFGVEASATIRSQFHLTLCQRPRAKTHCLR